MLLWILWCSFLSPLCKDSPSGDVLEEPLGWNILPRSSCTRAHPAQLWGCFDLHQPTCWQESDEKLIKAIKHQEITKLLPIFIVLQPRNTLILTPVKNVVADLNCWWLLWRNEHCLQEVWKLSSPARATGRNTCRAQMAKGFLKTLTNFTRMRPVLHLNYFLPLIPQLFLIGLLKNPRLI